MYKDLLWSYFFLSSVLLGFSSVETGLKKRKELRAKSVLDIKTTKKTVKTTSKVRPNYEEGGQKKI